MSRWTREPRTAFGSMVHRFSCRRRSDVTFVRGRNRKRCFSVTYLTFDQSLPRHGGALVYWLIQRDDEHTTYCTVQRIFELSSVMLELLKGKPLVYTTSASGAFLDCSYNHRPAGGALTCLQVLADGPWFQVPGSRRELLIVCDQRRSSRINEAEFTANIIHRLTWVKLLSWLPPCCGGRFHSAAVSRPRSAWKVT